jgi:superfamily II DNA or RNA helicase
MANNIALQDIRPYQFTGIDFLVKKRRAMLADQPGMGKTIQATEAAKQLLRLKLLDKSEDEDYAQRTRILVVCPGYLTEQWREHLEAQYPDDKVVAVPPRSTQETRVRAVLGRHDWLVVNKEMLRKYPFLTEKYYVLIIDESHHFANRETQQAKAAFELASEIPCVLLLTATPIRKDPDDLFMQYHLLDPDVISSYHQFVHTYFNVWQSGYGVKITGIKFREKLNQLMNRYSLIRTYKEVDLQLPKLTQKIEHVLFTPEESKRYRMIVDYWRDQEKTYNNILAAMQAMRQVTACEAKFEAATALAGDLDGPGVFFCWYRETAHKLYDALGHDKAVYIDGDTRQDLRPIQAKSGKHVVCTIAALSEGVDLSHANEVVFLEITGHLRHEFKHCLGCDVGVTEMEPDKRIICHYIMVKNSIDEKVHKRQKDVSVHY